MFINIITYPYACVGTFTPVANQRKEKKEEEAQTGGLFKKLITNGSI